MVNRALRPIFLLYFFTLVQLPEAKPQKAGWINVLLGIMNLILFVFFKERPIAAKEAMVLCGATSGKKESLTARGAAEMWYSSFDEYQRLTEPTFDNNTVVNNTVQLGGTAFLHCRVRNLGERTITWVRRRDWHILTSGMFTYTNDERFQVLHAEGSDDWTLQIKYVQKRDNGTYECQVSTGSGIMSHFVNLEIVVPEAFIVGAADYHVVLGGTINLVCVIEKSPTPPQYVLWYHNSKMINYDTTRGGVQVRTEQGQKTESHLTIHEAKDSDSGNYTCSASNTQPAYIHVFVSDGDKMAAISRRKSSSSGPIISAAVWYIALPVLLHRVAA